MGIRFDYSDGDYGIDMGNDIIMGYDGDLMQDIGGGTAIDFNSGDIHFVDNYNSYDCFNDNDDF